MSADESSEILTTEEMEALMPLRTKWRQELSSIEEQLRSLTERKLRLAGLLTAFNGVLPGDDTDPAVGAVARPQPGPRPAPATAAVEADVPARRGRFTPVEAYWRPMIEALVERGGRAHRDEVVELVGKKMESVLTADDRKLLPSGVEVRWKNRVAWQRENMKRRGLLRGDTPQGIWEITGAGREWLEDTSFDLHFFALAALRIGNLSGAQAHPVTMGGYRMFVRQYAQEFGQPALGEAADHLLTDPLVVLWKDGSMELRKYEPTTNLWWDFAEFKGDIRRLVGRGEWTMRLTEKGRGLLPGMEELVKSRKKNPIGVRP